ncbi:MULTISPECIES: oxalate/formate MFS antiporter [unclassified Bradyrhizobium]|uniref:oxalate/formate MFS antiporter n=1 Tax=unclassified Bradyrhizobium TaxID=2631580 RepID=UPI0015CE5EEB|nr:MULTISPECIES: oxalate/formate MFS antiporter [unclassified Bradyrhizobium]MBB4256190.1 OFA family oxalate/formate antiporter-like MFS transporter [Bradyrhizobium sp. CIR3A]NYG48358.1 OFA family oxalate/formate antiporter-like MFS transporter [Bradyrhizobium sp. IAR9]
MISSTDGAVTAAPLRTGFRWLQLVMGIVCMAMIANLQYGWTLFVDPIDAAHHWGRAAIQLAFTVFVVTETWLVPIEAWFVDKYGPRIVVMFGGVMIALSWILNSYADSLTLLYAAAIIGGMGAGAVYGTCVGNALKWFPDRRGLAAGATAAGFGAGAALTIVPIATMIASSGYQHAFFTFGIGQGVIVFVLAFFIQPPRLSIPPKKKQLNLPQTKIDFTPPQVLRSPIFWVMYLVFVMVASGGLMTAAQIGPIAHDFKIADTPVTLAGFQMAALTFAISLDRILDGFGRPFFGWVSDTIGREHTMFIAFGTAALMLLTLSAYGHVPVVFVLATAVYFGVFGEIYSLFPATCGDTFGSKFATTNNGMLYTAKGTASLLVPLASVISATYGWKAVFVVAVALNATAALTALFVIKPMRRSFILGKEVDSANTATGSAKTTAKTETA